MFSAYFDESGTHAGSPLIVIGGVVSNDLQWRYFEAEWKDMLTEFQIPYLHMRQFAHSIGPFGSWKGDEKRRQHFIQRLVGILRRRVSVGIGLALLLDAYQEVVTPQKAVYLGKPYVLCGRLCVKLTLDWAVERKYNESIRFVFESGARGAAELQQDLTRTKAGRTVKNEHRTDTFEFVGKKNFGALQAADFMAWELAKAMVEWKRQSRRPARESLLSLAHVPHIWRFIDTAAMRDLEVALHDV
jgi:Protein of unknown function (DUF3800)